MRQSTKLCVEQFVTKVSSMEGGCISCFEQDAIAYALYDFLNRKEAISDYSDEKLYDFCYGLARSNFELSDKYFEQPLGVRDIYIMAYNVCLFIEREDCVSSVFFNLFSMIEKWKIAQFHEVNAELSALAEEYYHELRCM